MLLSLYVAPVGIGAFYMHDRRRLRYCHTPPAEVYKKRHRNFTLFVGAFTQSPASAGQKFGIYHRPVVFWALLLALLQVP